MSNLLFLGFAVLFTAVGCTVIWYRQRKPTGVDTHIDAFRRELDALAPDRDITRPQQLPQQQPPQQKQGVTPPPRSTEDGRPG